MNRYTQMYASQYDPLSLQEVMMVPAMKRQKHDALNAQIAQSQLQADPLRVHEERALELKNNFEKKKLDYAERLAKEGVNSNITNDLLKFNKEYQDLISPMGEIGKINQAKVIRNKAYENWMKTEEAKKLGSQLATKRFMEHEDKYNKGYQYGKDINFISDLEAPAFEDFDKDLTTIFSGLGENTKDIVNAGHRFEIGPNNSIILVNQTTGQEVTQNYKQVASAVQQMAQKWLSENAPGKKWADFSEMDQNYIIEQINNRAGVVSKYKENNSLSVSRSRFDRAGDKVEKPTDLGEVISLGVSDVLDNTNLLDLINDNKDTQMRINPQSFASSAAARQMESPQVVKTKEQKVKEYRESQQYIKIFNALKRTNPEEYKNVKYNTAEADKMVKDYLQNVQNVKISNELVTPDVEIQSGKFPGQTPNSIINQRTNTLKVRLSTGNARVFDAETGKEITKDIKKSDAFKTIQYNGYVRAGSQIKMDTNIPNQKVNPDMISYTDSNGKIKSAYVSKDPKYFDTPEFKASSKAGSISKIANSTPGLKVPFKDTELEKMGLENPFIQYNGEKYILEATIGSKPAKFEFNRQEDIENFIYNAYNQISK